MTGKIHRKDLERAGTIAMAPSSDSAVSEAAIESVLAEVIVPLSDFVMGMAESIIAGQPKMPSIVCPTLTGSVAVSTTTV